jgi:hypothetical protein
LSVVSHSAENSYLDYPLSQMRPFEKAVALEFRAYVSSFIKTGNPNTRKLSTAPTWPNYGALGDFVRSPVRLVPQFAYESNANKSYPTGTEVEVAQGAGIQRTDYWQSIPLLDATRL